MTQDGAVTSASMETFDMAKAMREIAASGAIEVPHHVEFNGTLYVRAGELAQARAQLKETQDALDRSMAAGLRAEADRDKAQATIRDLAANSVTLVQENHRLQQEIQALRSATPQQPQADKENADTQQDPPA